ncbi:hypothetical protein, partial [Escherichia coli]|uniref:hypothetical protein n=1 Tax=Escherichia coli TaxID=562 RepID=UPI0039C990FD
RLIGTLSGVLFSLYKICTVTFQILKIFIKNNQVSSKSLQPNLSKISQGYVYLLSTRHTSYVTPFAKKPNIY